MSDESDAKQILTASPLENWRRPPAPTARAVTLSCFGHYNCSSLLLLLWAAMLAVALVRHVTT